MNLPELPVIAIKTGYLLKYKTFFNSLPVILPVIALLFMAGCNTYIPLSNYDYENAADDSSPLGCRALVRRSNDSVLVTVEVNARKLPPDASPEVFRKRYAVTYTLVSNYKSNKPFAGDSVRVGALHAAGNGKFVFNIAFIRPTSFTYGVMALRITEFGADRVCMTDVPLDFTIPGMQQRYCLTKGESKFPLVRPFVRIGDTITVRDFHEGPKPLFIKYYGLAFSPALPAMFTNPSPPRNLKVIESFSLSTDSETIFNNPGLYFAQEDSNTRDGFAFMVMPGRFPRVTRPDELVSPLIYITSREERNKLTATTKPKEELDKFWVEVGGSRDHARRVIREYYEHVETANNLFTSFKEGWKTDRGMVFIIFGKPERISKTDDREEWYYEKNANFGELYFTFRRKPTIFSYDNFELERFAEYDRVWYGTVEQWRKGVLKK